MSIRYLLCILLSIVSCYHSQAQCPSSSPGFLSGTMTNLLVSDTTPLPVYSTPPTGLPNTEFLILQHDSLASDGFGPRIIESTIDGRIVPADLGLTTCNQLCVLPFSYDLQQLQTVVDSLLLADYLPGTSCCTAAGQFFVGLCDSLNAHGIHSGSDINNLNDVIVLMGIFTGSSNNNVSVYYLTTTIGQLNNAVTLFGTCAGGITEICYSVSNTTTAMDCYTIALPNSANFVDIAADTLRIAPNGTATLIGTYLPNSASDSLRWTVTNTGSSITVDAMGQVVGGSTLDTAWIVAQAVRGCATDTAVVIVDPALSITTTNLTPMPLQTTPNPFSRSLQVSFYAQTATYQLQLIGITGQVYYEGSYNLTTGNQQLNIDSKHIPSGYYLLRITGQNMQGSQAVVKY
ncbi:T9SS type A sorting domain-containing protein [Aureispira anguillae]|uniref:T9SS type A sorting domain-containing protein n=1 Tax=Aureispira anguillae TaxID=2864201 RepID=A0A915YJD0_9BACT|nr:T9SS type A sorting domain-containing protein [Aureispira anguillae]BDS14026.1 T9SS type A sorting domain-containing protein [Aureispira anguillae]